MSEAYLISGVQQPAGNGLAALLQAIGAQAGIKPDRVDEIHVFSDAASALFQRRLDSPPGAVIHWPLIPFLPVSILFSACRALETGEISTCILAEDSAASDCAVLLANPNGVGRFNLTPQVQFANRFTFPAGIHDLAAAADKVLRSIPQEVSVPGDNPTDMRVTPKSDAHSWLAVQSPEKPSDLNWPDDRTIYHSSTLPGLMMLARAVIAAKTDAGVWISRAENAPSAALLVLPL